MNCKFLSNGLALSYDHLVKPCCVFDRKSWDHELKNTDLATWHEQPVVKELKKELALGVFPDFLTKSQVVSKYSTQQWKLEDLVNSDYGDVVADGVYDGYDTRGKSSEFKFYDTGEDD
jgi:hypothetical protein